MIFLGIDNGVSGSIGIIGGGVCKYLKMPVKKVLSYTKKKQWVHRIDYWKFLEILDQVVNLTDVGKSEEVRCILERPMVSPFRFKASESALRSFEATLIALEEKQIGYQYVDSRTWQKTLLPSGIEKEELKKASMSVAQRLYPKIDYKGFKDGDGLLIAEYLRRTYGASKS